MSFVKVPFVLWPWLQALSSVPCAVQAYRCSVISLQKWHGASTFHLRVAVRPVPNMRVPVQGGAQTREPRQRS